MRRSSSWIAAALLGLTDGAERLSATFEPPSGLAPGGYTLLVTLTDGAGSSRSSATAISVGEAQGGDSR